MEKYFKPAAYYGVGPWAGVSLLVSTFTVASCVALTNLVVST